MRKLIGTLLITIAAIACKQQADYKTVRDEVIKLHDVVMEDQGRILRNQMRTKDLLKNMMTIKVQFPATDTLEEKVALTGLLKNLNDAEESMNDWMHEFEPDVTGKSNEAAVLYFEAEKVKVVKMDSVFKAQIKSSDAYLNKFKK